MGGPQRHALAGRSGQVIADRFELFESIGSGAQSVVYRARDRSKGDEVALKLCDASDPEAAERIFREAQIVGALEGAVAVKVRHHCTTDDGAMVLVMELLTGSDLATVLHLREGRGQLAERSWLGAVLEPVALTLGAAHEHGIVHRGLKAENIFVLDVHAGGGIRLLDFGFATDPSTGSPSYLAPEIWRYGMSAADARSDIYAFGVLVFRMFAGRMPFGGGHAELSRAALSGPRPSLHLLRPDLPRELDAWVVQVLAVEPESRFSKIGAAWRALEECLEIY